MDKGTVFSKTGKGLLEIKNKSNRLPKDQFKILNLVDGKTALGDLVAQSRIPEIELRKMVGLLCDAGFIKELTGPAVEDDFPRAGVPPVSDSSSGEDDLDFTKILTPTEPAKAAAPPAAPPQPATAKPAPPPPPRPQEEQRSRLEEEFVRRQAAAEQQRKAQEQRKPPPPEPADDEDVSELEAELDALRRKPAPPSPPAAPPALARPAAEQPPVRPATPQPAPPPPIAVSASEAPADSSPQDLSGAFERARREAEQRAREEAIRIQQETMERRSRAPRKPK
jgi:hypothetical protein